MTVTALLTCFNRRELTLECLRRLFAADLAVGTELKVVLVDDGCTDGTGEAVKKEFSDVSVLKGDGSLFWCGGMSKAWNYAEETSPDFFLLLNDDTMLTEDALTVLMDVAPSPESEVIAVGAVADPDSGELSYGGRRRNHPSGPVPLQSDPAQCDTFNGNCVLIPREVRERVGALCGRYSHSFADFDYGLQATKMGVQVLQPGQVIGHCRPNPSKGTWQDVSLGRFERLRKLNSLKGMPWRDHLLFARRTQGNRWLRHFVSPYARILMGR